MGFNVVLKMSHFLIKISHFQNSRKVDFKRYQNFNHGIEGKYSHKGKSIAHG